MNWTPIFAFFLMASSPVNEAYALGLLAPQRSASRLDNGAPTLAPFAHVRFCKLYPSECRSDGREVRVSLTPAMRKTLERVNQRVNQAIRPRGDASMPGDPVSDVWTLSPKEGDCDDYATTKRHELAKAGFPIAALRLMIGTTSAGDGHAVLVVASDDGDLVLDNLTGRIAPLAQTRMRPMKIQSSSDPRRWLSMSREVVASR